jgi:mono/diheme cytochrome c family protein
MNYRLVSLLAALALVGSVTASARAAVDYKSQVKPIFAAHCFQCHGALKQKAGLRLDAGQLLLKGGKDGAIVQAGKPGDSLIVKALLGTAPDIDRMPREADPLKPAEIAVIRQWIEEGAHAPDEPVPAGPESHWAFKPPVRSKVPVVKNAEWVRNPIDAFVAAEHERRGLTPRPQADKATLLRRVTLDLIGIPPTQAELHAFLNDPSSDAYEKVVDRLLASPAYGQRWGRHWMDVWRYSDWAGYAKEVRHSQPHIWRWRDWIIDSLNADKPYDQMVREMLAGDEIAPTDPNTVRATGFLVRSWFKFNHNTWMEEVVEHTGKAFLGMTFNCAKCHDHMFDPVSQKEYFEFRAIFEPYDIRTDNVPGVADTNADGLVRVCDANVNAPTHLLIRGDERRVKTDEVLPPAVPAALGGKFQVTKVDLPPAAYYPGLNAEVRKVTLAAATSALAAAEKTLAQNEASVAAAQKAHDAIASGVDVPVASKAPANTFLVDDFASPRTDVWQRGVGDWQYKDGKLIQSAVAGTFQSLRSVANHPRDFTARVTFKTTGGQQYRSVGLSFDVTDAGDEQAVYLSATAAGPAASVFQLKGGKPDYDGQGRIALPIKVNEPYELRVDARARMLNVYVNDQLVLAYRTRSIRHNGKFAIWTYDASAEFIGVRVEPLAADVKLAEKGPTATPAIPPLDPKNRLAAAEKALQAAKEAAGLAKLKLNVARAEKAAVEAKIAADEAKYATPPRADAEKLSLAAGRAERMVAACNAEIPAFEARNAMAKLQAIARTKGATKPSFSALADAASKVALHGAALDAAKAAVDRPSAKYAPITKMYPAASTGRRTALANWITARDNPLAARVAANHIWMRHMGAAIVPTVFDFGLNGKPPTNQPLLDWLATELVDHGWSMKHLHRLIVTSATYRMRSDDGEAGASETVANRKSDPDNVYLWHANVRRMEAEVVRDSVLAVGGSLDCSMGGADIDYEEGLKSPRRSVYFRHAHEKQMTFLTLFDAASPNECYRRDQSVMPQQALALSNSSLSLAQSRKLAARITADTGGDLDPIGSFVTSAFERVLGRSPTMAERQTCDAFVREQSDRLSKRSELEAIGSGDAGPVPPSWDPAQRARENLVHVLINHNDFVTIR